MESKKLNLIIVSHPDDEILGFGGTGANLVRSGEIVQAVILCGQVLERSARPDIADLHEDMFEANEVVGFEAPVLGDFPNIRMNNVDHVTIVKFIEQQILRYQPTRIFTHHPGDLNDDHVQTSKACLAAARLFQRRVDVQPLEALYFMEILSSTDWAFPATGECFSPDSFCDISSTFELKLEALSCYRNVIRDQPHPRSKAVLSGHAAYRGGQCGYLFAEAFQTVFRRGI